MTAAIVHLQLKGATQALIAHTDAQGNYSFAGLREGVYALQAQKTGYGDAAAIPSCFLGPKEVKNVDLALGPQATPGSQPISARPPEFFDQPHFTVAGVTDTTSLGGHGSETIVRTRDMIAKEAASLAKPPAAAQPVASAATEKSLRVMAEREPRDFEANHQLGKLLIESGKAGEAIPYLERAAQVNPGDYETAYDLALANADAGNYARARENAHALLVHHDKADLHHLLGDVQEKLGNSLEAVREYQRAAELDPGEAYLFDWASELLLHHAPEPALEVFSQGNRLFPGSVRMLIGLGSALFSLGSNEQAALRICQASDLNPNDPTPYLFLGKMQSAETAPSDDLVEKLHRFVTLQPENAEANYYYAVGRWKQRTSSQGTAGVAQVESLLNRAIHLDPKFGAAYLQLGILHSELKDFAIAISDYQQAIQSAPQMEEAHYRLAQAYRQVGETDKAKAEFRNYEQMSKESAAKAERERHEIRQFVYTLRDQPPAQSH